MQVRDDPRRLSGHHGARQRRVVGQEGRVELVEPGDRELCCHRVVGPPRRLDRRPQVADPGVTGPIAPGSCRGQVRVELPHRLPGRDREALPPARAVQHRRDRQCLRVLAETRRRRHGGWRERNASERQGGATHRSSLKKLPSGKHGYPLSLRRTKTAPRPRSGRPSLLSSTPHSTGDCRSPSRCARPAASALHHRRGAGLPRLYHGKPAGRRWHSCARREQSLPGRLTTPPAVKRSGRRRDGKSKRPNPTARPPRAHASARPNARAKTSPSPLRVSTHRDTSGSIAGHHRAPSLSPERRSARGRCAVAR